MFALFREGGFTVDSGNKIKITEVAKKLGEHGEVLAFKILKAFGFTLGRPDYHGHYPVRKMFCGEMLEAGQRVEFEVKMKSEPCHHPFEGHGADVYQIEKRMSRYRESGIMQFFLVMEKNGDIYGQWLHNLEAGRKELTKNKHIRIYPIEAFREIIIDIPD